MNELKLEELVNEPITQLGIKNGDLFGIPPHGWLANLVCKLVKARTFHWGVIIGQDKDGYIASESLWKGASVTRFVYPKAYIYRIKKIRHEPETYKLVSYHSWYGEKGYDMQVNFLSAAWFIFKHFLKKSIPVVKNNTFNCNEWVVYMAAMMGYKIIPENEYAYPKNLENSPMLDYIGEYTDGGTLLT